jgi:hypothetical protein
MCQGLFCFETDENENRLYLMHRQNDLVYIPTDDEKEKFNYN